MDNEALLKVILDANEWARFECKRPSVKPYKLLETVISFLNTDGGELVVGLEDPKKASRRKRLIGISENPDNVTEFLGMLEREIDPPMLGNLEKIEIPIINTRGKRDHLLVLKIGKSDDIHSLKRGDTYVRRGSSTQKIGSREIMRLKYEKGTLKFEDERSNILNLDTIDRELLNHYKSDTGSIKQNDWDFLKNNGLAIRGGNAFYLTKAGALLFEKNPSVALKSKCGIKISQFHGIRSDFSSKPNFARRPFSVEGPLLHQIEKIVNVFKQIVRESPPKLAGARFHPSFLIPEWAFQEAIVNAVIHRNYYSQDDIQVRFFDNRVEIESPGTYPGHITTDNIRSERFSRNPIIQRTLNRFQLAPNLDIGEGVDRMFQIMKENNLYDPLYAPATIRPNTVLLTLLNLQRIKHWDVVNNYIQKHHQITNSGARVITGISDSIEMNRLLKKWVDQGLLEKRGESKKGTYYTKSGERLVKSLFS